MNNILLEYADAPRRLMFRRAVQGAVLFLAASLVTVNLYGMAADFVMIHEYRVPGAQHGLYLNFMARFIVETSRWLP